MWFRYRGQRYKILKAKISNSQDHIGKIINLPLPLPVKKRVDIIEIQQKEKTVAYK